MKGSVVFALLIDVSQLGRTTLSWLTPLSQVVSLHSKYFVVLPRPEKDWTNYVILLLSHFVSLDLSNGTM